MQFTSRAASATNLGGDREYLDVAASDRKQEWRFLLFRSRAPPDRAAA